MRASLFAAAIGVMVVAALGGSSIVSAHRVRGDERRADSDAREGRHIAAGAVGSRGVGNRNAGRDAHRRDRPLRRRTDVLARLRQSRLHVADDRRRRCRPEARAEPRSTRCRSRFRPATARNSPALRSPTLTPLELDGEDRRPARTRVSRAPAGRQDSGAPVARRRPARASRRDPGCWSSERSRCRSRAGVCCSGPRSRSRALGHRARHDRRRDRGYRGDVGAAGRLEACGAAEGAETRERSRTSAALVWPDQREPRRVRPLLERAVLDHVHRDR